jgi:hypothetical protein
MADPGMIALLVICVPAWLGLIILLWRIERRRQQH